MPSAGASTSTYLLVAMLPSRTTRAAGARRADSAASGVELDYAPLDLTSARHGPRPPKLEPQRGRRGATEEG